MELLPVLYYAFVHTLTPGHSKTLLLAAALSGRKRSALLRYALGFGIAHGMAMVIAVALGFGFKGVLLHLAGHHPEVVINISVAVLALACVYFVHEAWRIHRAGSKEDEEGKHVGLLDRRPLLTGMLVGLLPCPDVIGIGLVVPNLTVGMGQLIPTLIVVWLTVGGTIFLIGLSLTLLPMRRSMRGLHMPEWFPAVASALVCFGVIVYRLGVG